MMGVERHLAAETTESALRSLGELITGERPRGNWMQPYLDEGLPDNQAGDFIAGVLTKRHDAYLRERQSKAVADLEHQEQRLSGLENAFDLSVTSYNPVTDLDTAQSLDERVTSETSLHGIESTPRTGTPTVRYATSDKNALHRANQCFLVAAAAPVEEVIPFVGGVGALITGLQKGNTARKIGRAAREAEQQAQSIRHEVDRRYRSIEAASEFYVDGALFLDSHYDARDNTVRFDSPPQPYM